MKHSLIMISLSVALACAGAAFASEQPNVILIMTDDQGYGDVGAHGNPIIQTPHMDQLHSESIRLTDFHVDPTCAPTRGALMTGKYSHRVRVWHTVQGGNHLRASEVTMGDVFKANGYDTALFGKWHLGANYPYRPMDRGFDEWLGLGDGGPGTTDDYFWNDRVNDHYLHNGEFEYREGYTPDVLFDATIDYIKERQSEQPFFIYLPTYVPHGPWTIPDPQMAQRYLDAGMTPRIAYFFAMIERADENLGRLRKVLADEGLEENTILIFMTDNGSNSGWTYYNAGMKKGKGSYYDGGHRVPCFIHWPTGELGAPRDISTLTAHIDLLPTLVDLCGLNLPQPIDFDGSSLEPLLRSQSAEWPERTLVVEAQRSVNAVKGSRSAVMTKRWRLNNLKELYDMSKDPGQEQNVVKAYPEVVEQLKAALDQYWEHVSADDRSYHAPIVGTVFDEEILLSTSELRDSSKLWNHASISRGDVAAGEWHIEVAEAGIYTFELRRWPKEVDAAMTDVPVSTKTADSWFDNQPRLNVLEGDVFKALPVASVSLAVDTFSGQQPVPTNAQSVVFDVPLPKGRTTVNAALLDLNGQVLTNAYYVYVRKQR